ncbi:synaptopodin [Patagioenas fasciata monilis]|uniref:Synaptopodin n=1 Tax=Patagioenas fasciata monilis TaxID=372326 RepID=A0A1V4KUK4_PATFA|nr:synaptopodin [Patagioenas fasciata monilis]
MESRQLSFSTRENGKGKEVFGCCSFACLDKRNSCKILLGDVCPPAKMLKATLRQPCLQTQPDCPPPGEAAQNPDALVPTLDGSNLASATEITAPPECPSCAPELPPPAASPVADDSQEWKVVKIQRVIINPTSELRKVGLSRSASLSEKEGVLLFNRRKQRQAPMEEGEGQETKPEPGTSGEELRENMASTATNGVQEQATGGMQSGSPEEGKNSKVPSEVPGKGRQYYEVHLTLAKPKPVKNRTARPFGTQASPASKTLSSPPPLTRVCSPPAYSALYPLREQKMLPGILEESAARRGSKKSMFTFVEKPKLGPNPDLLDLVQSADSRKKQKEQGEPGADNAPAWSSCLKSPTIQPKPKPQPSHNLSEARGKGAELFARRQHPSKSPSRPSKTPPASLYGSNLTENEVSQKELEISKHQPYQLQSSLFILSPSKGPTSAGQTTSSPFPSTTALPLTRPGAEVLLGSPCRPLPPRAKSGFQAPRPSYSTRNAGIEPQERRSSLPASPTWTPRLSRRLGSLDGWASPASVPELDEGPPMSPAWSERSLSPLRQDADPRASRQMQARLARNIINAARRKSSSPKAVGPEGSQPFTPIPTGPPSLPQSPRLARLESSRAPALQAASSILGSMCSPSPTRKSPLQSPRADCPQFSASPGMPRVAWAEGGRLLLAPSASCPVPRLSPSPKSPLPSPMADGRSLAKRCTSRSPTDSDVSLDSEDSGAKSPGIHSFTLCPRGWTGSLRLKPGGLPSGAPCTS